MHQTIKTCRTSLETDGSILEGIGKTGIVISTVYIIRQSTVESRDNLKEKTKHSVLNQSLVIFLDPFSIEWIYSLLSKQLLRIASYHGNKIELYMSAKKRLRSQIHNFIDNHEPQDGQVFASARADS